MSLHVETFGSGAPLLLIHGWGMHAGMWGELVEKLAADFCVQVVDLPGHGSSRRGIKSYAPTTVLDEIVAELSARFAQPLTLCGWSLGGQIALRWAQLEPQKIQRLVLVSSTPCFAQRADWLEAMPLATLAEFAVALADNPTQTLRRFVALQTRGSDNERALLTRLRNELFAHGEPDWSVLQSGLDILRDCDLREALPNINQPSLVIAGERDTLTPPQASEYMAAALPDAQLVTIAGAAHAPFLSHPEQFIEPLKNFLHERI
ncbi:MAG: pimeloyl-ACP methyl ester esterase BioH [Sideroxydans sp.]|nr:pimeloyl-ACP methyl ester esterase BioH [Sideroxydans sp.]